MVNQKPLRHRQTEEDIKIKLIDRPIELIEMGRTVNDPYIFRCTNNSDHGNWKVSGSNVFYLKSGCPKCWTIRRREIRKKRG